jgi:hypothetical protein
MSETEYFRQACKDQVKFTDKVRANKDHEIALLELEIKKLKSKLGKDSRNLGHQLTGIDRQFKELEITHMGSEFEDDNYNNIF